MIRTHEEPICLGCQRTGADLFATLERMRENGTVPRCQACARVLRWWLALPPDYRTVVLAKCT
jgi:predicted Fe-S protein YdhL (DUF1289 family)